MALDFYRMKRLAMRGLLAWGLASAALGAAALAAPSRVLRGIGIQALAWGLIDAALALNGWRDANRQALHQVPVAQAARRDWRILALNSVLDAGYIAGGLALIRRSPGRAGRVAAGVGIVIQGIVLLLLDVFLAGVFHQHARGHARRTES